MKMLLAILLICTLTILIAAPVHAANSTDIVMGTPTIDGKLDDIYLESACHNIAETYVWSWGGFSKGDDMPSTGCVYFLWDVNYLYLCGIVNDATPTSTKEWGPIWQNDAIEHWFIETVDYESVKFKVHHAGDGTIFLALDEVDQQPPFDKSNMFGVSTYTDTGYIVETAIPFTALKAGRTFTYSGQLNDIWDSNYSTGYAKGSQKPRITFTCVADPTTENTEPTENTQPTENTPPDENLNPTKPANSNIITPIIVAAALCLIVVIAVLIIKAKKKK